MPRNALPSLIAVLALLLPLSMAHLDTTVNVVVEGVVSCQNCKLHGSWNLDGAIPIPKAKVSVQCRDHKGRVAYYKSVETDSKGYYYAQLDNFKMSHYLLDHPLHACKVKLVSSPNKDCNIPTNINYGMNGAPLSYHNKAVKGTRYEAVIYSAPPLAFRPTKCY
uniref:Pollen Ole e 1 allergen and extensin family protein n=1 Tax=Kalanchoe fedtschenkoi TaxID=63787 RepID=A0A7N0RES6_KALFE